MRRSVLSSRKSGNDRRNKVQSLPFSDSPTMSHSWPRGVYDCNGEIARASRAKCKLLGEERPLPPMKSLEIS